MEASDAGRIEALEAKLEAKRMGIRFCAIIAEYRRLIDAFWEHTYEFRIDGETVVSGCARFYVDGPITAWRLIAKAASGEDLDLRIATDGGIGQIADVVRSKLDGAWRKPFIQEEAEWTRLYADAKDWCRDAVACGLKPMSLYHHYMGAK